MKVYLLQLRQYYDTTFGYNTNYKVGESEIDPIRDSFSAHCNVEIREIAKGLHLNLHFVPAGGTGNYQPLDVRVFGALKAIAKKEWYERYTLDRDSSQDKASAVEILLSSWEIISSDIIDSAWNIFTSDTIHAEKEMNLTPRDVLPSYQGIISRLSKSKFSTKFDSITAFESRDKKDDDDSTEDEDLNTESEDDSSSESSEDDDGPPVSPPSEPRDEEEELSIQRRTIIEQQIHESLLLLESTSFSPGTPDSAAQLLEDD
jgi:hypothetical protein